MKGRLLHRSGNSGSHSPIFLAALIVLALTIHGTARANVKVTSTGEGYAGSGNSLTISNFDASTGSPNLILVGCSLTNGSITSITLKTTPQQSFTQIITQGTQRVATLWRLGPTFTNGIADISVALNGASGQDCGAVAFSGVASLGTANGASSTTSPISVTITSPGTGGVVMDTLGAQSTATVTAASPQFERWNSNASNKVRGAGSTSTPTSTMTWTFSGTSNSVNLVAVPIIPSSPTVVRETVVGVECYLAGNLVKWQTGYEVDNLGFHVYREEDGELVRLTPDLIAGSALLAGSGTSLGAGHAYHWWDASAIADDNGPLTLKDRPAASRTVPRVAGLEENESFASNGAILERSVPQAERSVIRYWLQDVNLKGKWTWHGPVIPLLSHEALPQKVRPDLLSELSQRLNEKYDDFWRIQDLKEKIKDRYRSKSTSFEDRFAQGALTLEAGKTRSLASSPLQPLGLNTQSSSLSPQSSFCATQQLLARQPAVKLFIKEEGWYRVSQSELIAAGLRPGINPRSLKLYMEGREQPIKVIEGSPFAIEFYGLGLDTPSTDTRVYWLIEGMGPGKRIHEFRGQGGRAAPPSFPYTVEKKDRLFYFAALKNGEAESFFGPIVTAEPVDQVLIISHPDPSPPEDPALEVTLQGVTLVPHRIRVLLNEVDIGEVAFEGQSSGQVRLPIPYALLLEGENLVTLVSEGDATDLTLIDSIRLTYWHTYTADGGKLNFTAQGGERVFLDGFNQSPIRVIDITDPGAVQQVAAIVEPRGSGYAIQFRVPGSGRRNLLAFTEEQVMVPPSISANQPSAWHERNGRGDLVIISHRDFLEAVKPLKAMREAQGLSVALIDVEDLYDEFNFGTRSPQAIKAFLAQAKAKWKGPPRFVLLVGDASFDPKNYLGLGSFDFVPTKLVETTYSKTASDDWFVDLNDDGLPEMAIGRLPVRTVEEANIVVSKIIGYEQAAPMREALLVADVNDGFDFEGASEELRALLPSSITVRKIFRGDFGTDAEARNALISSLNQGPLLVNYLGHGSVELWKGGVLSLGDAESLINGWRMPFFINMTCLNGMFHDVYTESLSEALLKAERGGAVAVWASSGMTEPEGQAVMNKELFRLLFSGESTTLGEAVKKAKAATPDPDVRRTWILFGDPTTKTK